MTKEAELLYKNFSPAGWVLQTGYAAGQDYGLRVIDAPGLKIIQPARHELVHGEEGVYQAESDCGSRKGCAWQYVDQRLNPEKPVTTRILHHAVTCHMCLESVSVM